VGGETEDLNFAGPLFSRYRLSAYSGCQNNVPIVGRYFVTTTYAAIFFSENDYDKRYNFSGRQLERF
jgi:hypothetical protein